MELVVSKGEDKAFDEAVCMVRQIAEYKDETSKNLQKLEATIEVARKMMLGQLEDNICGKHQPRKKVLMIQMVNADKSQGVGQQTDGVVSEISQHHVGMVRAGMKHGEFLNVLCQERGIPPSICYGDMDQKTMLLIVTDLAARAIDIPSIDNVINWDFPHILKFCVHRVVQAARAGWEGPAFSSVTSDDMHVLDLHIFSQNQSRLLPLRKRFHII
ncbi:hypothetical protein AgCh_009381 [Apium graveolens]